MLQEIFMLDSIIWNCYKPLFTSLMEDTANSSQLPLSSLINTHDSVPKLRSFPFIFIWTYWISSADWIYDYFHFLFAFHRS